VISSAAIDASFLLIDNMTDARLPHVLQDTADHVRWYEIS
jgi:hypothetical protein